MLDSLREHEAITEGGSGGRQGRWTEQKPRSEREGRGWDAEEEEEEGGKKCGEERGACDSTREGNKQQSADPGCQGGWNAVAETRKGSAVSGG
jgi:hypothetical protein